MTEDEKNLTKYFTLNEEQCLYANNKFDLNIIYVDFKCGNVIIEFDGDYWHSFPKIKERDIKKTKFISSVGYKLLRIPENDYASNKDETVNKCLKFIKENYNNNDNNTIIKK